MTADLIPVCLRYGIFEMGMNGSIIDRRECPVCNGDRCPYEVDGVYKGTCPQCFGTGVTSINAELPMMDGADSVCSRCSGTGVLQ